MLTPLDYSYSALNCEVTKKIMEKINFTHGGPEFDKKYPEGIPTQVDILGEKGSYSSGLVMFPPGHSGNKVHDLKGSLEHKSQLYLDFLQTDKKEANNFLEN